jgi:hypothetical protein
MIKLMKRSRTDKRTADGQRTDSGRTVSAAPRWVGWFTDIGRPLSAVVVMVLCAPGERHLAELAGWGPNLSWGMAGLLVMYAGIAAVVATVRPKGAPGKRTAVAGAIVSLLLAMAAQPVSHYFVTGWMTDQPRAPFWLVTIVSCVPPFVMGHLLHLAADPGQNAPQEAPAARERTEIPGDSVMAATAQRRADYVRARMGIQEDPATAAAEAGHVRARVGREVQQAIDELSADPDLSWGDAATWTPGQDDDRTPSGGHGQPLADSVSSYQDAYNGQSGLPVRSVVPDMVYGVRPDGQVVVGVDPSGRTADVPDTFRPGRTDRRAAGQRTDSGRTADAADMSGFIRDTWSVRPDMDRADMRAAVRRSFPDKSPDAVRKAVARAEEARQ